MDMSMASFIGSFRRISLIPLFLTCAWGQTENIFMTDDPDWYRLLMDSVSSGTARLQYRTGTDLPFSQRINVDISSRVTLRMYNQAGPEKSYETGNVSIRLPSLSFTAGPVLVSHACGFVTGRATSRQKPRPGTTRLRSSFNVRTTPYLSAPFSGFGSVQYKRLTVSAFSSRDGPGFSLTMNTAKGSSSLYHAPDNWIEAMFQTAFSHLYTRVNASFQRMNKTPGHLFAEILLKRHRSGFKIVAYTVSSHFNPVYGKNPWFSGTPAGCTGAGGGLQFKQTKNLSLLSALIRQTRPDGENVNMELYVNCVMGPLKSCTLLKNAVTRTLKAEKVPPASLHYDVKQLITLRQTFDYKFNIPIHLNSLWAIALDGTDFSTVGTFTLTYNIDRYLVRAQISHASGGTVDLWYTRPLAGRQVILQKAGKGYLTAYDICGSVNFGSLELTSGLSISNKENRITLQLKIALDSPNR
jgi:hypothetical protein